MSQDNLEASTPRLSDVFGVKNSLEDALKLIMCNAEAYQKFQCFPPREQQKVLSFIAGQRGLKVTYDAFFMKIMSPHLHPERLESFLPELLEDTVHIERVLPREGIRISEEASLVIMDILVQLSNGSRVDVEMQKLGLYFPGERSSCYAADAIMRQYTELKSKLKDKFTYKAMKPFYLVVLMENSSAPFKSVAPNYIHTEKTCYDSGAEVTSLSKIKYISLDTFKESVHNISNKLEAWLMFFSSDEPADILALISTYPEFCELYKEIAEFRKKPEELIHMYSEALAIADRNTVRLMIDDMQEELTNLNAQVEEKTSELEEKKSELEEKKSELEEKNNELAEINSELAAQKNQLAAQADEIARLRAENEKLKSGRQ